MSSAYHYLQTTTTTRRRRLFCRATTQLFCQQVALDRLSNRMTMSPMIKACAGQGTDRRQNGWFCFNSKLLRLRLNDCGHNIMWWSWCDGDDQTNQVEMRLLKPPSSLVDDQVKKWKAEEYAKIQNNEWPGDLLCGATINNPFNCYGLLINETMTDT